MRKLCESCDFQSISPDEILWDQLVFGIKDTKVWERLLCESDLSLAKQMRFVGQQMKIRAPPYHCSECSQNTQGINTVYRTRKNILPVTVGTGMNIKRRYVQRLERYAKM